MAHDILSCLLNRLSELVLIQLNLELIIPDYLQISNKTSELMVYNPFGDNLMQYIRIFMTKRPTLTNRSEVIFGIKWFRNLWLQAANRHWVTPASFASMLNNWTELSSQNLNIAIVLKNITVLRNSPSSVHRSDPDMPTARCHWYKILPWTVKRPGQLSGSYTWLVYL